MNRRAANLVLALVACGLLCACSGGGGGEEETLTLTEVSPPSGPAEGGWLITLYGTGFTADATVLVGGNPATDVIWQRSTAMSCLTPPGPYDTKVDVTIITAAGRATLPNAYEYLADTVDFTGWWEVTVRPSGSTDVFTTVTLVQFRQEGDFVASEGDLWTRTYSTIRLVDPSPTDPYREEWELTMNAPKRLDGTVTGYDDDRQARVLDLRYYRMDVVPSGSITATGTSGGRPVSVDTSTGFGTLQLDSFANETFLSLYDSQPTGFFDLEINYEQLSPLAPGTYELFTDAVWVSVDTGAGFESADSGTVTFEIFTTSRVKGSGSVTMDPGETLTFAFDVDIEANFDLADIFGSP
jgi:hypothetical protein